MTLTTKKEIKRGFVMTGGGAKGLYEAGVIQAFHLCGMEFDVITGSSIGAINSLAYAEYQLRKREHPAITATMLALPPLDEVEAKEAELVRTAVQVIDIMDEYIRALNYAWLKLPQLAIIDDSDSGPLGQIKKDLTRFDLNLPMLTRLLWWYTTPESQRGMWPLGDLAKLIRELLERVGPGGMVKLIRGIRAGQPLQKAVLDTYLERFNLSKALVAAGSLADNSIRQAFTGDTPVLQRKHLTSHLDDEPEENDKKIQLIAADRTLKDYRERADVEVRLTRTNFRTGLLEVSGYVSLAEFTREIASFFQLVKAGPSSSAAGHLPRGFALGSHRLYLPGNPLAINAALASGRYPGVFEPFPFTEIYPKDDPNNRFLYRLLAGESLVADDEIRQNLTEARIGQRGERTGADRRWEGTLAWLGKDVDFRNQFFPYAADTYIDGGTIDNTPTNTAVDSIRAWIALNGKRRRDYSLDLYAVLLHSLPSLKMERGREPSLIDVVARTYSVASAARLTSNAKYVDALSHYGDLAEHMTETVLMFLEAVDGLDEASQKAIVKKVREVATKYDNNIDDKRTRPRHFRALMKKTPSDGLAAIEAVGKRFLERRLPLDVDIFNIHPDQMPLNTLSFTERLGYRPDNAIKMLAMGCFNTLWDMRRRLEEKPEHALDVHDRRARALARKWVDITLLSENEWRSKRDDEHIADYKSEVQRWRAGWQCRRTECLFHAEHCAHGRANHPPGT